MNERTPERIFNLFYYANMEIIGSVGYVEHLLGGTDEMKIAFLKLAVNEDFKAAVKMELPDNFQIKIDGVVRKGIDFPSYRNLSSMGHDTLIFDNIYRTLDIPNNALVVITPVKNGEVLIEGNDQIKPAQTPQPKFVHVDKQTDWVTTYIDKDGFHFDQMMNDDFIAAVRILFNARHYVSAMKLLMIAVDTIAFLECGDVPRNFHTWLDTYVDLAKLDITSTELWEFRNSILHMTNLDSRKVKNSEVKRLMFYIAAPGTQYAKETEEGKYFEFMEMLKTIAEGISMWAKSYDTYKEKFDSFVERYDRVISDKRMTNTYYNQQF